MVDRDGPGANFVDFDVTHLEAYRAKKASVDVEPDFERTNPDLAYNLENTQDETPLPGPPMDWRSSSSSSDSSSSGGGVEVPQLSEENRRFLQEIKGKVSPLSDEELSILETFTAGKTPEPAPGSEGAG